MFVLLGLLQIDGEVTIMAVLIDQNFEEIIADIRSGKKERFDTLYQLTRDSVYFHAKHILNNEEDALDAMQETYLTAFQQLGRLEHPASVNAWLCSIAGHICYNRLRKDGRIAKLSLDDEENEIEPIADERDMPEAVVDKAASSEIVAAMIDRLPELQRMTIVLYYFDEFSVSKIAEIMDCPENTVKSRLKYARKSIEQQVNAEEKRGVKLYSASPAVIALALRLLAKGSVMPEAAGLKLGASIAAGCGYSATALSVTTATGTTAASATSAAGAASGSAASAAAAGLGTKIASFVLAGALAAGCITAGVAVYTRTAKSEVPSPTPTESVSPLPSEQPLTPEQALAYYNLLFGLLNDRGRCTSSSKGPGVAYADLLDFDGDGSKELYLYYLDQDHGEEYATYYYPIKGYINWCLHEQVYKWNGNSAEKVFDQMHSNDGSRAGRDTNGRILYEEGGVCYLCDKWGVEQQGSDDLILDMLCLRGNSFKSSLEVRENFFLPYVGFEATESSFFAGDELRPIVEAYGLPTSVTDEEMQALDGPLFQAIFTDGYISYDGVKKDFTYNDCRIIRGRPKNHVLYSISGDTPETVLSDYSEKFERSGITVIYNGEGENPPNDGRLYWVINDVQELLDKLKALSPAQPADALPAERREAFVNFVKSVDPFNEDRFQLDDCDGDGVPELLAVYAETDDPYEDPRNTYAEIYATDGNGQLVKLYTSALNTFLYELSFVKLKYLNKEYLAAEEYCGTDEIRNTYSTLEYIKGTLTVTHVIKSDDENDGKGVAFYADGMTISEAAFKQIDSTVVPICRSSLILIEDETIRRNGLSPTGFISKYGS